MKPLVKRFLVASLVLASIGAASAGLLSVVNLFTAGPIAANEEKAVQRALSDVFSEEGVAFEETEGFEKKAYQGTYFTIDLENLWSASKDGSEIGVVYQAYGKNSYGDVRALIGIVDGAISRISFVSNSESYGQTLEDEYLAKVNKDGFDVADIKCGATYGAKLVQDMGNGALADYKERRAN